MNVAYRWYYNFAAVVHEILTGHFNMAIIVGSRYVFYVSYR